MGKKTVFLLGNLNINLLQYEKHNPTNESLDSLSSNMFLPQILLTSQINRNSKALIGIFSNFISSEVIVGNLTATISDQLLQFLIAPDIFCNLPANKTNIFERNWSKFKVGLSPSKKICVICFIESPLKMIKNTLFHLQSSFHFQDI